MGRPQEIRCRSCDTPHYPDGRVYKQCECGQRVYFEDYMREKFGNPMHPKFPDEESSENSTSEEEAEASGRNASLDDFE